MLVGVLLLLLSFNFSLSADCGPSNPSCGQPPPEAVFLSGLTFFGIGLVLVVMSRRTK